MRNGSELDKFRAQGRTTGSTLNNNYVNIVYTSMSWIAHHWYHQKRHYHHSSCYGSRLAFFWTTGLHRWILTGLQSRRWVSLSRMLRKRSAFWRGTLMKAVDEWLTAQYYYSRTGFIVAKNWSHSRRSIRLYPNAPTCRNAVPSHTSRNSELVLVCLYRQNCF